MLNYDDRFEDNCVNENIHVKYITFFLKDIKEKIKDLEKNDESFYIDKILAKGSEFAYYFPGINVIESLVNALGYEANQIKYRIVGTDEYEYEWKIKKPKENKFDF